MMGRLKSEQGQLFYEFHLGDAVPEDHLVRKDEFVLAAIAQNLRRLASLVARPPPAQALCIA